MAGEPSTAASMRRDQPLSLVRLRVEPLLESEAESGVVAALDEGLGGSVGDGNGGLALGEISGYCHSVSTWTGISFLMGTVRKLGGVILKSVRVEGTVPMM